MGKKEYILREDGAPEVRSKALQKVLDEVPKQSSIPNEVKELWNGDRQEESVNVESVRHV